MDIAAVVVAVRVGADQGLMAGKVFSTEPLSQFLGFVHRQAMVGTIPWVKTDDIVVGLHIFPLLVLPIAEIGPHTGHSEVLAATIQRRNAVILAGDKPSILIQDGLAGKLVMFKG